MTPALRELVDQLPEAAAGGRVDAARGLVEEDDLRLVEDRAAERQPLLPAHGQRPRQASLASLEAGHLEHPGQAAVDRLPGQPVGAAEKADVLGDGEVLVERELLGHVADDLLDPLGLAADVEPADRGGAGGRVEKAAEHPDGRGFAGPVGPQEAEDGAALDLEAHGVDGGERAEPLGQRLHFDGMIRHGRPRTETAR